MLNKIIFFRIFLIVTLAAICCAQQDNPQQYDSRSYERKALEAYRQKDYPGFLDNLKQADSINPNHPRITYNISIAYLLNQRKEDTLSSLNKLAAMKLNYAVEEDEDFASLKNDEAFKSVVKRFKDNRLPTDNATPALELSEKGAVPESVAFNPKKGEYLVASVAQRKIFSLKKSEKTSVFADRSTGLWSVLGIKVDAKRQILWAAAKRVRATKYPHAEQFAHGSILNP